MAIFHISGSDARLVSARLTDLVAELIGDGDRGSLFESHDLADSGLLRFSEVTLDLGVEFFEWVIQRAFKMLFQILNARIVWNYRGLCQRSRFGA